MPDKLTDSEIVTALECCTKLRYDIQQPSVCVNCPYYNLDDCTFELKSKALDLINRLQAENDNLKNDELPKCKDALRRANEIGIELQAENERLKEEKAKLENKIDEIYPLVMQLPNAMQQAKAEAYKECIEKVKETAQDISEGGFKGCYLISKVNLDNLLKELVGEDNAEEKE